MTSGSWHQLPSTSIAAVFPTQQELTTIDPVNSIWAVEGPSAVINDWTSSAYDPDGHRWYFGVGGGHNGYNGNELYAFDLTSLVWTRLYDPSPLTDSPDAGSNFDRVPVWGPEAVHHYDGMVYSPKAHSIFLEGTGEHLSWQYDTTQADPKIAWTSFPKVTFQVGYDYNKTGVDPSTGAVLLAGGGTTNMAALDPVTHALSQMGGLWDQISVAYSVGDVDPVRRRMFIFNDQGGVTSVDVTADPLTKGAQTLGGAPPGGFSQYACFIHDTTNGLMWAWDGGRTTLTFDPDAATWTLHDNSASAEAPTPAAPVDQKCIYVPELDVFAGYSNVNEGVWLYKP